MSHSPIDPLSSRPGGPSRAGRVESMPSSAGTRADRAGESAPAFEALLEKLERHAEELRRTSRDVSDAERLSGAVDRARASLEDALGLGDRLLEAYRQAAQQRGAQGPEPSDPHPNHPNPGDPNPEPEPRR